MYPILLQSESNICYENLKKFHVQSYAGQGIFNYSKSLRPVEMYIISDDSRICNNLIKLILTFEFVKAVLQYLGSQFFSIETFDVFLIFDIILTTMRSFPLFLFPLLDYILFP